MKSIKNYNKLVKVVSAMENGIDVFRKKKEPQSKLKPFFFRLTHMQMLIEIYNADRSKKDITLTDINLNVFDDSSNYGNTYKRLTSFNHLDLITFEERDYSNKNSVHVHLTPKGLKFVKQVLKCFQ